MWSVAYRLLGWVGSRAPLSSRSWPDLKISFFLVAIWAESKIWYVAGAQVAVPSRPFGARGRAGAAECAQTAGGAGAVLRPERAKNRLPAPPERGYWRAERRRGAPTCHWAGAMAMVQRWLLWRWLRKIRPRTRTPSARTCTRWGGEFDFFFASRFYLELAVAIPDAPGSALRGFVVGVRI